MNMNIRHFAHGALLIAVALLLTLPLALQAAKAVPVTVTNASPSAAIQGAEIDVIISGTGFGNGSTVKYLVTGTTDASQVAVLSVTYIPATGQLKTRIKVNGEALTNYYDIEVLTATGRKGKGTTLFKVNLDPSVILPVSLGVPAGCSSSSGTGLNDGAYLAGLIVTANTFSCTTGKDNLHRWKNGVWSDLGTLGTAYQGVATGVSDDGTVSGMFLNSANINTAVVVSSAGALEVLPALAGVFNFEAMGISENGRHIFGNIKFQPINNYGEYHATRWNLDLAGDWNIEVISPQQSKISRTSWGSSDDGSIIVGHGSYSDQHPDSALWNRAEGWVWVEGAPPNWVVLGLDTAANDVSPGGEMIVGTRYQDDGTGTGTRHPIAVYWVLGSGGNWVSHDLMGLDAQGSVAYGVGMVNGKPVIVGFGNTGSSQVRRAVAWLPQPDGSYGAPIRLAAIDGKSSAYSSAEDVNANGVVTGHSVLSRGANVRAVLWMLPAIQ
ncbi:MAG: hypothetical protein EHM68_11275 [Lysobacterales bacterium]|nr:MAG: hypothetical protein EHM68_11275 [Xanthomonadales bacterium]